MITTPDTGPRHTILLLGNYRPALAVARELAAAGHEVWVSRDRGAGAASRSRAVTEMWQTPENDDPAVVYPALAGFLARRPDITTVVPLMERYVRSFFGHAHLLPPDRLYVMPNRTAVETCLDKARLLRAVADAGLPCARHVAVRDMAGLRAAVAQVGFPVVVKPADSTIWLGSRKALVLRDRAALETALPDWPDGHAELIAQAYVDGPRQNLYFAARHGRPIRYLAAEIRQTDLSDGTGLATAGVTVDPAPDLLEMAGALIGRLDYHGVGCMQVLRDHTNRRQSFLEINPRFGGNHAVTTHAGLGLGPLALRLAAGQPVDDTLRVAPAGLRYVWTTGALRGVRSAHRNGDIGVAGAIGTAGAALLQGLTCPHHVTWSWRDPAPALTLLARGVGLVSRP